MDNLVIAKRRIVYTTIALTILSLLGMGFELTIAQMLLFSFDSGVLQFAQRLIVTTLKLFVFSIQFEFLLWVGALVYAFVARAITADELDILPKWIHKLVFFLFTVGTLHLYSHLNWIKLQWLAAIPPALAMLAISWWLMPSPEESCPGEHEDDKPPKHKHKSKKPHHKAGP